MQRAGEELSVRWLGICFALHSRDLLYNDASKGVGSVTNG